MQIITALGTLLITGFDAASGAITYSYTENGTADSHSGGDDSVVDSFVVTVTDITGASDTDTLDILITDTVPVANDDSNSITEDSVSVTGNVVSGSGADTLGADSPTLVSGVAGGTVGVSFDGLYGSVVIEADGSYTYTLDNSNPLVQSLNTGASLTESFDYTITDADGDSSTATLTITINGADEPTVTSTVSDDDNVRVNTDGNPTNNLVHTGIIENVDSSAIVTINGLSSGITSNAETVSYSWDAAAKTLTGSTTSGTVFTLEVNSDNTGYTFTQVAAIDHLPTVQGESESVLLDFELSQDGLYGTTHFSVTVFDDAPTVTGDTTINTLNQTGQTVIGTLPVELSTDDPNDFRWTTDPSTLPILYADGKQVQYELNDTADRLTGFIMDSGVREDVLTLQANLNSGTYELRTYTELLGGGVNTSTFDNVTGGNSTSLEIIDGNNNLIIINLTGERNDAFAQVNYSSQGISVNGGQGNWIDAAGNEILTMDFTTDVTSATFSLEPQSQSAVMAWVAYRDSVEVARGDDVSISRQTPEQSLTITAPESFDRIEFSAVTGEWRPEIVSISYINYLASVGFTAGYMVIDADGDYINGNFDINLAGPGTSAPTITAGSATVSEEGLAAGLVDGLGTSDTTNLASIPGTMTVAGTANITLYAPQAELYSNGTLVTWTGNGTALLTGSANGSDILTVSIDNTGAYNVSLLGPVDHAQTSIEDTLAFDIGVTVSDGTYASSAPLTITIEDDAPVASHINETVQIQVDTISIQNLAAGWTDPVFINNNTANTSLINNDSDSYTDNVFWGNPATGSGQSGYTLADNSAFTSATGSVVQPGQVFVFGNFNHQNWPIYSNSSILDRINLVMSMDVAVNSIVTNVQFTVNVDHNETPNTGADPRDIITLPNQSFTFDISGQDYTVYLDGFRNNSGFIDNQIFTSEQASNPYQIVGRIVSTDPLPTVNGNVSGSYGADSPDVPAVVWGNTSSSYGNLTVDANGNYSFEVNRETKDSLQDGQSLTQSFEYTIVDADGDQSTASLTINISGDSNPAPIAPTTMPFRMEVESTTTAPMLDFSNLDTTEEKTDATSTSENETPGQGSTLTLTDVLSPETDTLLEGSADDVGADNTTTPLVSGETTGQQGTTAGQEESAEPTDPASSPSEDVGSTTGGLFADTPTADVSGGGGAVPSTDLPVFTEDGTEVKT